MVGSEPRPIIEGPRHVYVCSFISRPGATPCRLSQSCSSLRKVYTGHSAVSTDQSVGTPAVRRRSCNQSWSRTPRFPESLGMCMRVHCKAPNRTAPHRTGNACASVVRRAPVTIACGVMYRAESSRPQSVVAHGLSKSWIVLGYNQVGLSINFLPVFGRRYGHRP